MIRHSLASDANPKVVDRTKRYRNKRNGEFFAAELKKAGGRLAIGLVGQRDLPGVAIRRAQAVLRWDLRPSLWSHAFLLVGGTELRHVTLHPRSAAFPDPATNAVIPGDLSQFDDPEIDANVAVIHLPLKEDERERIADRALNRPNLDRLRYDLWHALGVWQSYFWSAGAAPNPLREGIPEPSSAFVEYCYEEIRLDLTPGASERNSAPEHLWNTARRWHKELEQLDRPISGAWVMRDPYCTLMDPPELERVEARYIAGAG